MILCKECNGEMAFNTNFQKNGTTWINYKCRHCNRQIDEIEKVEGYEYK